MAESMLVQFRALYPLSDELEERAHKETGAPVSEVARRDLGRYYYLLRAELPAFSEGEAGLIVDVLNGHITTPETAHLLWVEVQDALSDGAPEKWGVDGPALVERLRGLSRIECMAVADAAERFWMGPYRQGNIIGRLHKVGLVRGQAPPAIGNSG